MLTRDKNKRPSAQDLLQTDIFKKFKRAQTPGKSPFSKDYSKEVTDLQYLVAFSLDNVSQALATNPSLNSNKSLGKEEERKADDNLSSEMLKIKENLSETIISQNSSETLYPRTQSKEEFVTLARSILEEMPRDVKGESKPKMNETFARTNKTYGNTLELSLTGSKFLTISPEEKAALQSIGQKTMESTLTKKGENGSLGVKQKSSSARKYPSGPNREEDEEDYEYDDDFEEDYEEEEAEKDLNQFDSDSQLVRAKMTKGLLEDSGKPEKDYEFDEEDAYQSIEMEIALQSFQKSIGSPEKSMKKTMRLTSPHEEGDDIAEEIPEENDQFENSGKFVYDEEKMMEVAKLYKEQLDSAQNYPIMLNKYAVMEGTPYRFGFSHVMQRFRRSLMKEGPTRATTRAKPGCLKAAKLRK